MQVPGPLLTAGQDGELGGQSVVKTSSASLSLRGCNRVVSLFVCPIVAVAVPLVSGGKGEHQVGPFKAVQESHQWDYNFKICHRADCAHVTRTCASIASELRTGQPLLSEQ